MANNLTDATENILRDYFFRSTPSGTAFKPQTYAVALCSVVPTDASTAQNCSEIANAGGYVRQTLAPSDANFSLVSGSSGVTYNNVPFSFPVATANWGWVSGVLLCDSATYAGGAGFFWGSLSNPRDVQITDQFSISVSGLSFSWD